MKRRSRGPADGPLVVKLSGIAGGTGLYEEEMSAAAGAGFRVVALDTSGDRRDDPAPARLTWEGLAREVEAAVEAEGGRPAILWGTSFGCLVALAAAARYPARVRGLLLCHPPDPLVRPRLQAALLRWTVRSPLPDLAARVAFSACFIGLTSWEGLSPPLWPRTPRLLRSAFDAATPASTVRRKLELLLGEDPGLPPAGAAIRTEIVASAWDLVAPLSGARRVAARIPDARVQVIGLSGHAGAYARPRAHCQATLDALRRLSC